MGVSAVAIPASVASVPASVAVASVPVAMLRLSSLLLALLCKCFKAAAAAVAFVFVSFSLALALILLLLPSEEEAKRSSRDFLSFRFNSSSIIICRLSFLSFAMLRIHGSSAENAMHTTTGSARTARNMNCFILLFDKISSISSVVELDR